MIYIVSHTLLYKPKLQTLQTQFGPSAESTKFPTNMIQSSRVKHQRRKFYLSNRRPWTLAWLYNSDIKCFSHVVEANDQIGDSNYKLVTLDLMIYFRWRRAVIKPSWRVTFDLPSSIHNHISSKYLTQELNYTLERFSKSSTPHLWPNYFYITPPLVVRCLLWHYWNINKRRKYCFIRA